MSDNLQTIIDAATRQESRAILAEKSVADLTEIVKRLQAQQPPPPPIVIPTTPPPTPPASGVFPSWLDEAAWEDLTGKVKQVDVPGDLKSAVASLVDGDTLSLAVDQTFDTDVLLNDSLRLKRNNLRLTYHGNGKSLPAIVSSKRCVLSCEGSRVMVNAVRLKAKTPGRQQTSGAYITGKDVRFSGVEFDGVGEHCINVRPSARRVHVDLCEIIQRDGYMAGYFMYVDGGGDIAVTRNKIYMPYLHAFRGNDCGDIYVGFNSITRNPKGAAPSGLVIFGIVTRGAVVGNTFHGGAYIQLGPNMDANGLAQAGGSSNPLTLHQRYDILVAEKCENITVKDNKSTAAGRVLNIEWGSDDIDAINNTSAGGKAVEVAGPQNVPGTSWPKPVPVNVRVA